MKKWIYGLCTLITLMACMNTADANETEKKKILIVVSEQQEYTQADGNPAKAGIYFSEIAIPLKRFVDWGYDVAFTSQTGQSPQFEPGTNSRKYFGNNKAVHSRYQNLVLGYNVFATDTPDIISFQEANSRKEEFAGVFIPGGNAQLIGLSTNEELGKLLNYFHTQGKPIALSAQGVYAITSTIKNPLRFNELVSKGEFDTAKKIAEDWIYSDYKITTLNDAEVLSTNYYLNNGKKITFTKGLQAAANNVEISEENGGIFVVAENELLTGQNYQSVTELTDQFLEKVTTWRSPEEIAAEKAKAEAEAQAKAEAEEAAKAEAEAKAEDEAKAKAEEEAKAEAEAEAEAQAKAEAEAQAKAEAEVKAAAEAQAKAASKESVQEAKTEAEDKAIEEVAEKATEKETQVQAKTESDAQNVEGVQAKAEGDATEQLEQDAQAAQKTKEATSDQLAVEQPEQVSDAHQAAAKKTEDAAVAIGTQLEDQIQDATASAQEIKKDVTLQGSKEEAQQAITPAK